MRALFLIFAVCALVGCSTSGVTRATWRSETTVERNVDGTTTTTEMRESTATGEAPKHATVPPAVTASPEGATGTGGAGEGVTATSVIGENTGWIGGVLIFAGVVAAVASFVFPVVPLIPSLGVAGAGGAVLLLPAVIPYTPWILLVLASAGALAWWHNRQNERKGQDKERKKPLTQGAS